MNSRFIDLRIGRLELRALLLDGRSPISTAALWAALPIEGRARHDEWSGELVRILVGQAPSAISEPIVAYQHPGLLVQDPTSGDLAIAYGQGRLQNGLGPLPAVPVALIGGDLGPLAALLRELQFSGAVPVRISVSADQRSALPPAPRMGSYRLAIHLGRASASATLLDAVSPRTVAAFRDILPVAGRATNTYSSGPLVRFWNPAGGPEGETPLDVDPPEPGHVVLYPGHIYYYTSAPWRGIRVAARDATVMRNAIAGSGMTKLTPLATLDGDWTDLRAEAERLQDDGAKPLRFERLLP